MSKELIEQLRDLANCRHDDLSIGYEAADRIEELERENSDYSHLAGSYLARAKIAEQERDQLREKVKMLRDVIEQLIDDMGDTGHCVCEAAKQYAKEALAATGKDFEGLVVCHAKPLAWARYPRFTGVAQTTPVVVFKKPDGKDWTPLFATTEQKP